MRRIKAKQPKPVKPETFFESKKKMTIAGATVLAVLIIIGVLLYIESTDNKIVIKNKTDLKLEYVKAFYVGPEEAYTEGINVTELTAGETESIPQETINLLGAEANLEVRFKFEGYDELFVDSGYFNDIFSGKTSINFIPTNDGKIKMTVKARNGIINSKGIICDDYYTINLAEGYIED
ncbi:MAG: hypothetical protein K0R34_1995 [Herbinix sp.]|jgi:hypothetical protein|nr:hypothetical protein [Herbinix sp.]